MIIIAVSEYTLPYPSLPGTLTSAERLAKWARQKGPGRNYNVLEITDADRIPVTVARIKDEISTLLKTEIIDRLVVYFAGHGLVRSAADQFWLLTNAAEDRSEGIALSAFINGLKHYGIGALNSNLPKGQLCIIADACRNTHFNAINFSGDPILTGGGIAKELEIDFLMATTLGHFAFQQNAIDGGKPYCLFSDTLCDALEGTVSEVIEKNYHPFSPIISNHLLARYLDDEVPKRANQFNEDMQPDTATGLRMNHNYYDILSQEEIPFEYAAKPNQHVKVGHGRRLPPDEAKLKFQPDRAQTSSFQTLLDRADYLLDRMSSTERFMSSVVCEGNEEIAFPPNINREEFLRDGRVWLYRPFLAFEGHLPLFVRQEAGWTLVPILPFTRTVLQEDAPGDILLKQNSFSKVGNWDTSLSSMVANSHLKPSRLADAIRIADEIRSLKEMRPNNANIAGYLYDMAGDRDNAIRTAHYMHKVDYVSLDLALIAAATLNWEEANNGTWQIRATLAAVESDQTKSKNRPAYANSSFERKENVILGSVLPIFRQGWQMMEWAHHNSNMPAILRELAPQTQGYSAVVLPDEAMQKLAEAFHYRIGSILN